MDVLPRLAGVWWRTPLARRLTISRLRRSDAPRARELADVVAARRTTQLDADGRRWIARIERLRGELARDDRSLTDAAGASPPRSENELPAADRGTVSDILRRTAVGPDWGLLLFSLVRELGARRIIEMGTGLGASTWYLAAALEVNGAGQVCSLEGSHVRAQLASDHLDRLGLGDLVDLRVGSFTDTLPLAVEEAPVDLAFVDGHHREEPTRAYFEVIAQHAQPRAVVVLDDIAWSAGMRRAWRHITAEPRVLLHVDVGRFGLCVLRGGAGPDG